jgi:tRNA uridine 5-carboxymethylaminomethyl modification enzyme
VSEADAIRVLGQTIEREYSMFELLRRPNVSYAGLMTLPIAADPRVDPAVAEQVEIAAKYQGYIDRQQDEVAHSRALEDAALPDDIDYALVHGLSREAQIKLNAQKPETIGQASRIQGITPASISLLLVHVKRGFAAARVGIEKQTA